ncbi:MAG: permease-like cell division protein FtsX, partial [Patescibacteria group bacterium]
MANRQQRGRRRTTVARVFKTGFINFFRNFSLSVAATAVMTVTLTIVLFFVIANATFNHSIQEINNKIVVSVYLKDGISDQKKDDLINKLRSQDNVSDVKYISKSEALAQYREDNKENLELLLAVSQTDNPLPATIQIKPKNPSKNDEIKAILERSEIKELQSDETSYSGDRKEAIDKITRATSF